MTSLLLTMTALISQASDQQLSLLKTFREEFVLITPGTGEFPASFIMGCDRGSLSEQAAHRVTMEHAFHMARYEVPQNLWAAIMGSNPSRWKGPRNSVEELSFDDAQLFCEGATRLMRAAQLIAADEVVRLPTEAEWEYAARAGTTTRYSFGDDASQLGQYGWFNGNAAGNDPPVGAKKPNAWKLYDMHGYLWEWCVDPWHPDYRDVHVLRGGSWKDKADRLTSTYRRAASKDLRDDAVGLRCVLSKESPAR
jgi:formylglycine-generating enzyme required for sulfatase activity